VQADPSPLYGSSLQGPGSSDVVTLARSAVERHSDSDREQTRAVPCPTPDRVASPGRLVPLLMGLPDSVFDHSTVTRQRGWVQPGERPEAEVLALPGRVVSTGGGRISEPCVVAKSQAILVGGRPWLPW
jgi:hypothetical protein